jgi:transcriptional regulator with XRE-family HTH domain
MPATPIQIARNGHIAALIRDYLKREGMSTAALGHKLGVSGSAVSLWVHSKGAPREKFRPKLAKILGVGVERLLTPSPQTAISTRVLTMKPQRQAEILGYSLDESGYARIRLDITLPQNLAAPLLRMILDAGIILPQTKGD